MEEIDFETLLKLIEWEDDVEFIHQLFKPFKVRIVNKYYIIVGKSASEILNYFEDVPDY